MDFLTKELGQTTVSADTKGSLAADPAPSPAFNYQASLQLLSEIAKIRPQTFEKLQNDLNSLHACLQEYTADEAAAANASLNANGDRSYQRLSLTLINKDKNLADLTARAFSSAQNPVGAKDAAYAFEKSFDSLPKAFDEGTACGNALAKTFTESLSELADRRHMGVGLKRDLASRNVSFDGKLSKENLESARKVLNATASFVKNNSQKVLSTLPADTVSSNTPSLKGKDPEYTQSSSDDKNADYGEILKQQRRENARTEQSAEADRPVSDETAQRIRCIIARAAAAARRGNLYPDTQPQESNVTEQNVKNATNTTNAAEDASENNQGNEVSLSELAARASKLQQQFREDRRKLAEAGKLPDPAAYPEDSAANAQKQPPLQKADETVADLLKNATKATEDLKNVLPSVKNVLSADHEAVHPTDDAWLQSSNVKNPPLSVKPQDAALSQQENVKLNAALTKNVQQRETDLNKQNTETQNDGSKKIATPGTETAVEFTKPLPSAAAFVKRGGNMPIPEQSKPELSGVIKDGGLFSKLAALFTKSAPEPAVNNSKPVLMTPEISAGNALMRANPLDHFMKALSLAAQNPVLPKELRREAKTLSSKLLDPISDLSSANGWLSFVQGPMSPDSPRAVAMQQWAFLLLCLRYKQLGKSVNSLLKKSKAGDLNLDDALDDMLLNHPDSKDDIENLSKETLSQIARLQNKPGDNNNPLLMRYLPLPPTYEGGREGSLFINKEQRPQQKAVWHLSFNFDLKDLGWVEIKAAACLPEVKLSFATEKLQGLKAVQDHVDDLTASLAKLGLEPSASAPRLGSLSMLPQKEEKAEVKAQPQEPATGISVQI